MQPGNDSNDERPLFSAILTPHRALGRRGFLALMLAIACISFIAGLVFFVAGAWPVVGFLGLDVLLVYWAFRANYRAARAYEEVTVTPSQLKLRRVSHRGEVAEWTANPLWVRVERQCHVEFGVEKLFLVSRGLRLAVARFLPPKEKESFAAALLAALAEAKRRPTRTVIP